MSDTMGGFGLEVVAGIKAATGSLEAELRKDRIERMARVPIPHRRTNTVTIDSGGDNAGFSLGGPALGRYWHVRRLVVGRVPNWGQTAAGTAEVFVAALPPAQMALSRDLSMLVDEASGTTPPLPSTAFYGEGQVVVLPGEHVIIVIVGGTANAQYVATIQAMDYNLALAPEVVAQ